MWLDKPRISMSIKWTLLGLGSCIHANICSPAVADPGADCRSLLLPGSSSIVVDRTDTSILLLLFPPLWTSCLSRILGQHFWRALEDAWGILRGGEISSCFQDTVHIYRSPMLCCSKEICCTVYWELWVKAFQGRIGRNGKEGNKIRN